MNNSSSIVAAPNLDSHANTSLLLATACAPASVDSLEYGDRASDTVSLASGHSAISAKARQNQMRKQRQPAKKLSSVSTVTELGRCTECEFKEDLLATLRKENEELRGDVFKVAVSATAALQQLVFHRKEQGFLEADDDDEDAELVEAREIMAKWMPTEALADEEDDNPEYEIELQNMKDLLTKSWDKVRQWEGSQEGQLALLREQPMPKVPSGEMAVMKQIIKDNAFSVEDMLEAGYTINEIQSSPYFCMLKKNSAYPISGYAASSSNAAKPRNTSRQRRVDPADGQAYTWEEINEYYKGKYKMKEIKSYWNCCGPAQL